MRWVLCVFLFVGLPAFAQETPQETPQETLKANQLFGAKTTASNQPPAPLGFYSNGCLAGGEALAETGAHWQAMRLSRNRNWGHPDTIDYIKTIAKQVAELDGWAGLYIGDISQPRGGPMTSGHQSHQLGLDVDIWLYPPNRLDLTQDEREALSAVSVRSEDSKSVNNNWTQTHMQVLKIAASDPRVDRIFITPPAKIFMCAHASKDPSQREWLQKIRPYWQHNYHFHVRLKCPAGTPDCQRQSPDVQSLSKGGDGCDETLQWWVTEALKPKPPPDPDAPPPRTVRDYIMADLPAQCQTVLTGQ